MASNGSKVGTSTESLMNSTPFVGGLNTELSGIIDSTEFTKDELNMMIRPDGTRSRRPGVDYEECFRFNNELIDTSNRSLAFNAIEWLDINSPDESETYTQIPYIVVQIGYQVIFYNNRGQPYSQDEIRFVLDLRNYKISGKTDEEVASERCKFTVAYGCLFITSKAIKPIRLRSAQPEEIYLPPEVYPSCEVACSAFQNRQHDTLDGRMGSFPNTGHVAYYEFLINDQSIGKFNVNTLGAFPNSYTMAQSFNSINAQTRRNITAVPFETAPDTFTNKKIDDAWSPADSITFNASSKTEEGVKISVVVYGWILVKYFIPGSASGPFPSLGGYRTIYVDKKNTYTAYMTGSSADYQASKELDLVIRDNTRGAQDLLAVDFNPKTLSYAHLYNLLNQGWTPELLGKFYAKSKPVAESHLRFFPGNNLAQQYLKDKKTDAFKPEDLINMTFGNTPAARGHFKLHFFDQDRNGVGDLVHNMAEVVVQVNKSLVAQGETGNKTIDDLRDEMGYIESGADKEEKLANDQVPVIKPRRDYVVDICTFAGRVFYLCGDVLLYSQMLSEDISKSDQCYTDADPTSEELSDVIETDGGLISLPDIGEGIKLAQFGEYLFVFGSRGNAFITGTANNIFTATAYSAGSLDTVPTQAPDSFVNTEFGLFYWGTTGISVIGAGQGGLACQDISTPKILTWFGKLSNTQHKWCKGVYSSSKKKVYWFYPSDDTKPRRLDMCLVYDIQRGSFAPQKITEDYVSDDIAETVVSDLPEVVTGLSLKTPFKSVREYPICTVPTDTDANSYEVTNEAHDTVISKRGAEIFYSRDTTIFKDNLFSVPSEYQVPGGTNSNGTVYRCDLSQFADMPNNTEKELVKYFRVEEFSSFVSGPLDYTMNLSRDSSGNFYIYVYDHYSSTAYPSTGPYTTSDIIWFINWLIPYGTRSRYFGFASEAELGGSGYTAQTLPDSLLTISKTRGLSSSSMRDEIICQFDVSLIGDIDTGFSKAVIVTNSISGTSTFARFYGTLPQGKIERFYIRKGTGEVYEDLTGNGIYTRIGNVYGQTATYYTIIDNTAGDSMFEIFENNGVLYYVDWFMYSGKVLPSRLPVYTKAGAVASTEPFVLCGFCTRPPTKRDIEVKALDGTIFTADRYEDPIYHYNPSHWNPVKYRVMRMPSDEEYSIEIVMDGVEVKVLADDPIDSEAFTYESSILVCLDVANMKITFGDFRNNLMKDWTSGDWNGDGYTFDSYLISHPMNASSYSQFTGSRKSDIVHTKNMPYMISYFRRTETGSLTDGGYVYPSKCQGSILWDWRTSGRAGKWSSPTDLYRPHKDTIFDNGFIVNKTNIRGLGRAYQVKLESVDADQLILEGLVFDLKNDGRI